MMIVGPLTFFAFLSFGFLASRYWRLHFYSWQAGLPVPRYRVVVQENILVPMHDGVKLATDLYRPNTEEKCPVIIIRTIYNKSGKGHDYRGIGELYASNGYVVAIQDVRGKHASEGEFNPYINEGMDGNTTITWAGKAPWSNGRVALSGISYLGSCAWLAAQYKNPFLKTIMPMFTSHNPYHLYIDKGIPYVQGLLYWLSKYTKKSDDDQVNPIKLASILRKLPVNELDIHLSNQKISHYREYLSHIKPDAFWKTLSLHTTSVEELDIPAFIVGGWYDHFFRETLEDYQRMMNSSTSSKNKQSVIHIGAWSHNPTQKFKELDFGPQASFYSIFNKSLKWCDYWLKEEKSEMNLSPVNFFMMGKNEWFKAKEWPPRGVFSESLYLGCQDNNKILSSARFSEIALSNYPYDPEDPVSFRAGHVMHGEHWGGPTNQTGIMARKDVLIFTSSSMKEDLMIAGSVKAILYLSSTSLDTDFFVKICDVYPDGRVFNLATGFIRMRYRDSLESPVLMTPGQIYRIEIDLHAVANTFLKGHSIQLQITSSDFPTHARNLNTGLSSEFSDEIVVTTQTLYTGGQYDSQLILPILPIAKKGDIPQNFQ